MIYKLTPGSIAAYMTIEHLGVVTPVVYISKERGALIGSAETPLAKSGIPEEVQAKINWYFDTVFNLPHETWYARGDSPRAVFVDEHAGHPIFVELKDE